MADTIATNAQRPSGVTTTPNGVAGVGSIAVRTPCSTGAAPVAVPHPGDGSDLPGKTTATGVRAGLPVQPAQAMIASAAAQRTAAASGRMPGSLPERSHDQP
jgi:hypothetical protein